jgi:hypothetical protein
MTPRERFPELLALKQQILQVSIVATRNVISQGLNKHMHQLELMCLIKVTRCQGMKRLGYFHEQ